MFKIAWEFIIRDHYGTVIDVSQYLPLILTAFVTLVKKIKK